MKNCQVWTSWYVDIILRVTAVVAQKLLVVLVMCYALSDYFLYPQGFLVNPAVAVLDVADLWKSRPRTYLYFKPHPSDRKHLQEEFSKVLNQFLSFGEIIYSLIVSGKFSSLFLWELEGFSKWGRGIGQKGSKWLYQWPCDSVSHPRHC